MTHTTTQTSNNKKITTKVSQSAKDILNKYDINSLLTLAIPRDYSIPNPMYLEVYKTKTKFNTPVTISLTDTAVQTLNAFTNNYPKFKSSEILSYLLENVCDLSRINTKDITRALEKYYEIAASDPNRHIAILDAYADSLYYHEPVVHPNGAVTGGLDDESLAYFLLSDEGQKLLNI